MGCCHTALSCYLQHSVTKGCVIIWQGCHDAIPALFNRQAQKPFRVFCPGPLREAQPTHCSISDFKLSSSQNPLRGKCGIDTDSSAPPGPPLRIAQLRFLSPGRLVSSVFSWSSPSHSSPSPLSVRSCHLFHSKPW